MALNYLHPGDLSTGALIFFLLLAGVVALLGAAAFVYFVLLIIKAVDRKMHKAE
ncbi:MAG TPA: hypothetical protein VGV38_23925 [Pyrinomonadaceae bacterium]|nr:hypothetical protein [Pyrinomonadaceae bacterium]